MQTNDPARPLETLTCSGIAEETITAQPVVAQFGRISRDSQESSRVIKLRSSSAGPISPELLPIRQRGDSVDAQLCEVIPGEEYDLHISVAPPWPTGTFRVPVRVESGIEGAPPVMIFAMGTVQDRVTANPGNLYFAEAPGEKREQSFSLNWLGGPPAKILDLSSTIDGAQLHSYEEKVGHRIVVSLPADLVPAPQPHRVTVRTTDPEMAIVTVPVTFQGIQAGSKGIVGRAKPATAIKAASTGPLQLGNGRRAVRLRDHRKQLQASQRPLDPASP